MLIPALTAIFTQHVEAVVTRHHFHIVVANCHPVVGICSSEVVVD